MENELSTEQIPIPEKTDYIFLKSDRKYNWAFMKCVVSVGENNCEDNSNKPILITIMIDICMTLADLKATVLQKLDITEHDCISFGSVTLCKSYGSDKFHTYILNNEDLQNYFARFGGVLRCNNTCMDFSGSYQYSCKLNINKPLNI